MKTIFCVGGKPLDRHLFRPLILWNFRSYCSMHCHHGQHTLPPPPPLPHPKKKRSPSNPFIFGLNICKISDNGLYGSGCTLSFFKCDRFFYCLPKERNSDLSQQGQFSSPNLMIDHTPYC